MKIQGFTFAVVPRGNGGTIPHPEFGLIIVENRCFIPMIITFGEEPELLKIYSKIMKNQFSLEIFIKNYLEKFKLVFVFRS